jgi:REP-associated tyrosine transposase
MPIGDDTYAWRRDLPHLQRLGKTYFITFTTLDRRVLTAKERDITLACIVRGHRRTMALYAAVVMPDHVHLLAMPDDDGIAHLMQQLKGVSAHQIGQPVWQREYFDRIIRSTEDLREKGEYIIANPVRAGLVERAEDYPWIWRWWVDDLVAP